MSGSIEPGEADAESAVDTDRLTLTVVVCAYTLERWQRLCEAVRSLRRQQRTPDEIVLVVDHCPELEQRAAHAQELAGLRIVANRHARGLSGARNTGIACAHGQIVAFLDDDAAADPDWTEHLLAGYADRSVLGVGGLVRPMWDTGRPGWFPREFDWVVGCTYRGMPTSRTAVRNLIGANMSFRRDVLAEVGGFRVDLGRVGTRPIGCEETDLCIRAAARHPRAVIRYEPAAAVGHHVTAQRATWSYFRARCFAEGLSKASVSRHVGKRRALASERSYLCSTIPAALLRTVWPGRQRTRLPAALAVASGVAVTVCGYAIGLARTVSTAGAGHAEASGGVRSRPGKEA